MSVSWSGPRGPARLAELCRHNPAEERFDATERIESIVVMPGLSSAPGPEFLSFLCSELKRAGETGAYLVGPWDPDVSFESSIDELVALSGRQYDHDSLLECRIVGQSVDWFYMTSLDGFHAFAGPASLVDLIAARPEARFRTLNGELSDIAFLVPYFPCGARVAVERL